MVTALVRRVRRCRSGSRAALTAGSAITEQRGHSRGLRSAALSAVFVLPDVLWWVSARAVRQRGVARDVPAFVR